MRTEEADGYLENLLVRPVSRTWWLAGRLGLSCLLLITAGVLAGIGAWASAASQHSGVGFGSLVTDGLNFVPLGLFLLGLGAWCSARGRGGPPRWSADAWPGRFSSSSLAEWYTPVTGYWTHPSSSTWFPPPPPVPTGRAWRSSPASGNLAAVLGAILLARRDQKNA